MTPNECLNRPHALPMRPARLGVLASLSASLLLGACSQTSNMLPSLAMKPSDTETAGISQSSQPATPESPQSELQKATVYWGDEYAKKPTDLRPALNYAKNLKALGEKQKAFAVLQQASMFHSNDRELAGEYGRLALDLDQVGAANQLLAIADDPTKPDWRVISARGTVLAKQGKYSDAIPFYERAMTLSQNNPSVMNNLAMAYAGMGDPKKAEEILREASSMTGAAPKVRENLAIVLGLQGRYDESRAVAGGVLQQDVASANADYLKQMVKLEPRSALPDAQSFASQTTVARATPPPQPAAPKEVVVGDSSHATVSPAQMPTGTLPSAEPAAWSISVDDTPLR